MENVTELPRCLTSSISVLDFHRSAAGQQWVRETPPLTTGIPSIYPLSRIFKSNDESSSSARNERVKTALSQHASSLHDSTPFAVSEPAKSSLFTQDSGPAHETAAQIPQELQMWRFHNHPFGCHQHPQAPVGPSCQVGSISEKSDEAHDRRNSQVSTLKKLKLAALQKSLVFSNGLPSPTSNSSRVQPMTSQPPIGNRFSVPDPLGAPLTNLYYLNSPSREDPSKDDSRRYAPPCGSYSFGGQEQEPSPSVPPSLSPLSLDYVSLARAETHLSADVNPGIANVRHGLSKTHTAIGHSSSTQVQISKCSHSYFQPHSLLCFSASSSRLMPPFDCCTAMCQAPVQDRRSTSSGVASTCGAAKYSAFSGPSHVRSHNERKPLPVGLASLLSSLNQTRLPPWPPSLPLSNVECTNQVETQWGQYQYSTPSPMNKRKQIERTLELDSPTSVETTKAIKAPKESAWSQVVCNDYSGTIKKPSKHTTCLDLIGTKLVSGSPSSSVLGSPDSHGSFSMSAFAAVQTPIWRQEVPAKQKGFEEESSAPLSHALYHSLSHPNLENHFSEFCSSSIQSVRNGFSSLSPQRAVYLGQRPTAIGQDGVSHLSQPPGVFPTGLPPPVVPSVRCHPSSSFGKKRHATSPSSPHESVFEPSTSFVRDRREQVSGSYWSSVFLPLDLRAPANFSSEETTQSFPRAPHSPPQELLLFPPADLRVPEFSPNNESDEMCHTQSAMPGSED
eukprot:TRINITY_DN1952_c0_g1_i2.p1 TRINITY_DN1952_c0_g1~~TRINITY_DN1952_c0_g1_i2.p1  ORF type:complete len:731 (-),score=36.65 TRINITY_DN1952_c0_g1_i2:429-2621(-)